MSSLSRTGADKPLILGNNDEKALLSKSLESIQTFFILLYTTLERIWIEYT